jgi:hypothetical protein
MIYVVFMYLMYLITLTIKDCYPASKHLGLWCLSWMVRADLHGAADTLQAAALFMWFVWMTFLSLDLGYSWQLRIVLGLYYSSFLCWVDHASRIMWMTTNSMHGLCSVYWVITTVHVSGVSAAHHQEVERIYGKWYLFYFWVDSQLYHLPHIYILPPDDGLLIARNM